MFIICHLSFCKVTQLFLFEMLLNDHRDTSHVYQLPLMTSSICRLWHILLSSNCILMRLRFATYNISYLPHMSPFAHLSRRLLSFSASTCCLSWHLLFLSWQLRFASHGVFLLPLMASSCCFSWHLLFVSGLPITLSVCSISGLPITLYFRANQLLGCLEPALSAIFIL